MKQVKKVLTLWIATLSLFAIGFVFLEASIPEIPILISLSIQVLLFYFSLFIVINEPTRKHKFIFLNFTLFFVNSFLYIFNYFGFFNLFFDSAFSAVYIFQYLYIFLSTTLAFAIAYLVFDLLFHNFKIYQKYLATAAVVLGVAFFYYHPFLENPQSVGKPYIYTTENIQKYRIIRDTREEFINQYNREPNATEIAALVTLPAISDGEVVGQLYAEANIKQIEKLLPYTKNDGSLVLLYQPFYFKIIYMDVFVILFILLYCGYQYAKDPPQGAYIDKMMYVFLVIFSLDIFHQWAVIKSVEFAGYMELFGIGQYFSAGFFAALVIFFYARLKFIKSVVGEFYEVEIQTNPEKITRWMDGIDKYILKNFTSSKDLKGRLFEQR
ncbi:MAG: hypothetical protein Q8K98_07740 [Bacteroidota bacterium]|nr:hypothetical protein [Bacteroidota bacterium]